MLTQSSFSLFLNYEIICVIPEGPFLWKGLMVCPFLVLCSGVRVGPKIMKGPFYIILPIHAFFINNTSISTVSLRFGEKLSTALAPSPAWRGFHIYNRYNIIYNMTFFYFIIEIIDSSLWTPGDFDTYLIPRKDLNR